MNQMFGKMLEEALVRMEWLPFSPEVLLGWALPSCTAATPRPCLWPCLCSRLATHPRWTQVKGCEKHTQLVHKACLALETKHHMLEQPEQKDEPKAKGAESRRAREMHRESTRTPCFMLPHSSLWALEGDSEMPPLLSLQLRGAASPTSFSDILLLRWLLCGHLPLFAAFGHHHPPPLCLTASPAVLAAGESSGRITNLGKEMRSCPCAMVPSTEPGRQAPVPLSLTRKAQRVPALLACHTGPAASRLRLEIHRFLINRESTRAFLSKDA